MTQPERRPVDRSYKRERVRWMLENYHALLSARSMSTEDKAQMSSVVTSDSQWWNSQAQWRKVDRKADLDAAIEWVGEQGNRRGQLIIDIRYRSSPYNRLSWDEIAVTLGLSRRHIFRLHERVLTDIAWYLGGIEDK